MRDRAVTLTLGPCAPSWSGTYARYVPPAWSLQLNPDVLAGDQTRSTCLLVRKPLLEIILSTGYLANLACAVFTNSLGGFQAFGGRDGGLATVSALVAGVFGAALRVLSDGVEAELGKYGDDVVGANSIWVVSI